MRHEGLAVGAYYSKADWHAHSFWDPAYGFPTTRNTNYDKSANSTTKEKWDYFVKFDQNQLAELQARYNPDYLWLDGGWVGGKDLTQSIDITGVVTKARAINPELLVINRDGVIAEDCECALVYPTCNTSLSYYSTPRPTHIASA
jgi:alpha-L-fucosidase